MKNTPVYFSKPSVICSSGLGCSKLWENVTNGKQNGIKKVKLNSEEFSICKIDTANLKTAEVDFETRIMRICNTALSGLEKEINFVKETYSAGQIGVCLGSCDNGTELSLAAHNEFLKTGKFPGNYSLEFQSAGYPARLIKKKYGLLGPALTFSTACSSSASAIIKAAELIKSGLCKAVIAGGADIVSNTVLLGFNSLEAVSKGVTNPFSKNRDGITLGEGAAFFVMTAAPIDKDLPLVKLLGYGESSDSYHITTPDPEAEGAASAIEKALFSAGLTPEQIDYINLHGTGTKFNDSMEAKAINKIFKCPLPPASTTKPITGHTLGAAGAIEAALCSASIFYNYGKSKEEIKLPLQVWDGLYDKNMPSLNIYDANNKRIHTEISACMSNSFAFGGANSCLIIGL